MATTTSKAEVLRRALARQAPVLALEAHDAPSAKIVEEAGFDAVWASGLTISITHGVPDLGLLDRSEMLTTVKCINDATTLPVIVDVDDGYGGIRNVIQLVKECEAIGVAAIIIEEKGRTTKANSLDQNAHHSLEEIDVFSAKLRAAKQYQRSPHFLVVARIEALIAGLSVEEALKRANTYTDAGADAIVIHWNKKDPSLVYNFIDQFKDRVPVIVIPTSYSQIPASELASRGVKLVIYANHLRRASITTMRAIAARIRNDERTSEVEAEIASVKDLWNMVGTHEVMAYEERLLRESKAPINALILAAGETKELGRITDLPVALMQINKKSFLEWQAHAYRAVGVEAVGVVTGWRAEKITLPGFTYIKNPDYAKTGIYHTLQKAKKFLTAETLVSYGDIYFSDDPVRRILVELENGQADIVIAVDPNIKYGLVSNDKELVMTEEETSSLGSRMAHLSEKPRVLKVSKKLVGNAIAGEFIGLAGFSKSAITALLLLPESQPETDWRQADLCDALNTLIAQGIQIRAIPAPFWYEIDKTADVLNLLSTSMV
ncbi:isocitrate lyase/phosphoenolpyruvate mutase family protein [Candidatus Berkelbacteria bacterium]|nr:isocitrate lyase/phosphoenolpyruvate mutase family protein [Candidatus Berkelbacteria bacterium]